MMKPVPGTIEYACEAYGIEMNHSEEFRIQTDRTEEEALETRENN